MFLWHMFQNGTLHTDTEWETLPSPRTAQVFHTFDILYWKTEVFLTEIFIIWNWREDPVQTSREFNSVCTLVHSYHAY